MNLSSINIHSLSEALAWTLFHSIWQAALIAGILAFAFRIINKNNARLRYTMASLGMLFIFVLACFTFILSLPAETLPLNISFSSLDSIIITDTNKTIFSWSSLKSLLPTLILFPILLKTWIIGICLLSLRMVFNYTTALRLKKHKAFPLSEKHITLAFRVLTLFKIKKKILFRESSSIDSPSLIGYFRPVVLLPISLMSGIPDNQMEIIIAHELAHISRHDYLVQFIQGIIEILFFYHPMVWWLSSVVNTEREHICDDLAVKVCGGSLTLIKALNNMESIRRKKPELVLSFSGKKANLLHRIRRILNPVTVKHPKLERGLMSALFVFAVSGMIFFSNLANSKNQVKSLNSTVDYFESVDIFTKDFEKKKNIIVKGPNNVKTYQTILPDSSMVYLSSSSSITYSSRFSKDSTIVELEGEAYFNIKPGSKIKIKSKTSGKVVDIDCQSNNKPVVKVSSKGDSKNPPLYIIDGVETSKQILDKLDPDEIESMKVLKDATSISIYGTKGENGVILITSKKKVDQKKKSKKCKSIKIKGKTKNPPLYIVDGVEFIGYKSIKDIDPENIESITVLKDKSATEKYGNKAKNGVILITTKNDNRSLQKSNDKTTVKVSSKGNSKNSPLYILNDVEIGKRTLDKLDPDAIESMTILKDATSISTYGTKGENGVILITSKKKVDQKKKSKKRKSIKIKGKTKNPPLYIVDGVEFIGDKSIKDIDPENIESITVLKDKSATEKYGNKAKNGVIKITTKRNKEAPSFNEYMKKQ